MLGIQLPYKFRRMMLEGNAREAPPIYAKSKGSQLHDESVR